ncbi:DUF669 domain-containing protein [Mediterraneibacter sp. NSJ-151]|jgi:hypothetical protein|uniref:DUF669 domain-containing protein n=1 Tax=Mediterraneibacter sp. NSJ-151 TaxID=2897708 RepID=UPI001F0AEC3A|nr:DUF669 domain-containing protein [Mediterraneibacter sp. NSJ-151]MCH4280132.1 DUF669 domain-containing protein [Mediterraneibacter sp. NSJ-151]
MSEMERELDWNDEIEKDSDFTLLPEGDYDFTVESFERGRHPGSDKLPACNKAILKLRIDSNEGSTILTHNLFLHTKTEGMISAFFTAIGQKKKGEKVKMNWNAVIGAKGRCKLSIRNWKGNDGEEHQSNEIKKFYEKEEKQFKAGEF